MIKRIRNFSRSISGGPGGTPPPPSAVAMKFNVPKNSQYLALIGEDF